MPSTLDNGTGSKKRACPLAVIGYCDKRILEQLLVPPQTFGTFYPAVCRLILPW